MKKQLIATLGLLLAFCLHLAAVPAKPGKISWRQPDGSVKVILLHGDEFMHWATDESGQVIERDADGYWRPAVASPKAALAVAKARRARLEGRRERRSADMTHGERHIPAILVEYTDVKFTVSNPAAKFEQLLNQAGYAYNGGTGSVQDFYRDNSGGAFIPVFDVYGPVTLPQPMKYYGEDTMSNGVRIGDRRAEKMVSDGVALLDGEVDFSRYDYDGNGEVDMVLVYYAGYNQAEGGPEDSVWPHQYYASGSADGKSLGRYFCTSELKGASGNTLCGIGTTCHEFGHSLGLPDFYDTNYDEDGYSPGLYAFSTMCHGSYNNQSRTPPHFNAEERAMLGWMADEDMPELPEGALSIPPIRDNKAYRSLTYTEGEYFIYEYRDGKGWDSYLPSGMVVYHVDKAKSRSLGGVDLYSHWANWGFYNDLNASGDHPCFYVVAAPDPSVLSYDGNQEDLVFPGAKGIEVFHPIDWDGDISGVTLSDIRHDGTAASAEVTYTEGKLVFGQVTDRNGRPLQGVGIRLQGREAATSGIRLRSAPALRTGSLLECTTDAGGRYSFTLAEDFAYPYATVSAEAEGYIGVSEQVDLGKHGCRMDFVLIKPSEVNDRLIQYYNPDAATYVYGSGSKSQWSIEAMRIPNDVLAELGKKQLKEVYFSLYDPDNAISDVWVLVENDYRQLLAKNVSVQAGGTYSVDLTADHLATPLNGDLYVGMAVYGTDYPFYVLEGSGNLYAATTTGITGKHSWRAYDGYDLAVGVRVGDFEDGEDAQVTLADYGFNCIAMPAEELCDGMSFPLQLHFADGSIPDSVSWSWDGASLTKGTETVRLNRGHHTVEATLTYADGSREVIEAEMEVL